MIRLENIEKRYHPGQKNEVIALQDINMEIKEGEMVALVGKSGAGKSTLLNIIGGIDSPTGGSYRFGEKDVAKMSAKEQAVFRNEMIGFVLQDFGLVATMSVYENISIPLCFSKKIKWNEMKTRVKDALKLVGLEDKIDRPVVELSGGEKQRVAIARAMVNEQKVILADEPTGALDTNTSEEIMHVLKRLQEEGKTVVIVTHDMELAGKCDRVVCIKDGKTQSFQNSFTV